MPSKIEKFLAKLSAEEFEIVTEIIDNLIKGNRASLDIKKLKGQKYIYRVRKGNIRIIYYNRKNIEIISIDRRSEKTYRDF